MIKPTPPQIRTSSTTGADWIDRIINFFRKRKPKPPPEPPIVLNVDSMIYNGRITFEIEAVAGTLNDDGQRFHLTQGVKERNGKLFPCHITFPRAATTRPVAKGTAVRATLVCVLVESQIRIPPEPEEQPKHKGRFK